MTEEGKPPYRVLLVESDSNQLMLFSEELRAEGYDIVEARTKREALGAIEDLEPAGGIDLLISSLDLNCPREGLDLICEAMSKNKYLKTVLNTSQLVDNFYSYAPDAIVDKSSDLTKLKATIKQLLAQKNDPRYGF